MSTCWSIRIRIKHIWNEQSNPSIDPRKIKFNTKSMDHHCKPKFKWNSRGTSRFLLISRSVSLITTSTLKLSRAYNPNLILNQSIPWPIQHGLRDLNQRASPSPDLNKLLGYKRNLKNQNRNREANSQSGNIDQING